MDKTGKSDKANKPKILQKHNMFKKIGNSAGIPSHSEDNRERPVGKLTVLVLSGGPSSERQVSLAGGKSVAAALREAGYSVIEADIAPDNLAALDNYEFDIVFPVLHGTFGEDGQLQAILEKREIVFVGSGSVSSRLAMDKHASKVAFCQAGLPTPDFVYFSRKNISATSGDDVRLLRVVEKLPFPYIIKPNLEGSSVGVRIIKDKKDLPDAVRQAVSEYGQCLVEAFISGREFTVGIVGEQTLPVIEVVPADGFYDYQAKYVADNTEYKFDTDVSKHLLMEMQQFAYKAFKCLGCRDLARVDFILDSSGRSWLLEVNTLPGFTEHSLLPKAAARDGLDMPRLCNHIVQIALSRTKLSREN